MSVVRVFLLNLGLRRPANPWVTPPLGVLSLAAYIRKYVNNVDIKILNQRVENNSVDELTKIIVNYEPHIVGLSCSTIFAYLVQDISYKIKQLLPSSWVVLGGPHVSSVREQSLIDFPYVDVGVPGEGEISFKLIVESFPNLHDLRRIPGIIWRDKTGEVVINSGLLQVVENLDNLPIPAYDLIDLKRYWKLHSLAPVPLRKYASIFSSRGCPYQCMWCHSIFGKKIRLYSPERIIDEISYLQRIYGINDFEFLDDNFNFNRIRVIKFAEVVNQKKLKIRLAFPNGIRGDLANDEEVEALISAGTYSCGFALDTGSTRLQKFTQKKFKYPKVPKEHRDDGNSWCSHERILYDGISN